MQKPLFRTTMAAVLSALPAVAQAGNEVIFIGTSTSGSTDNHAFVESGTGLLLGPIAESFTDNVTDAVWANTGRNLYVGQSLGNRVARAQWNGSAATWSAFYPAPGACYGLGYDQFRQRLWTLTGPTGNTRELHCIDADPLSPTYGSQITATSVLSGASRERWSLSWSGNVAAVPYAFPGLFEVVDTDPASATFLQVVVSTSIPGAASLGFALASDCEISYDDNYFYVLMSGLGAQSLAVYDRSTASWLDFDGVTAGQQDLAIPLLVPNRMELSFDASFLVISGQGSGGWAARVNFDYTTPSNTTFVQYAGLTIPNANAISLSPDGTRAAITSTVQQVGPPGQLVVIDAVTGAILQNVSLGTMWNIYTTAWQDASPTATFAAYGAGCSGTLGVPTWAAAPGSRPALGTTFTAIAGNLPFGIAVAQLGFTATPGGVDLTFLGMPGCAIYPNPIASLALFGAGSTATWQLGIPNTQSLFGAELHTQVFPLDPAANAFGFTASNAALGTLGL